MMICIMTRDYLEATKLCLKSQTLARKKPSLENSYIDIFSMLLYPFLKQSNPVSITNKLIIVAILSALAGAIVGGVCIFQIDRSTSTNISVPATITESSEWKNLIKHNCELSGGSFVNEKCKCDIEADLGQTQEMMYDKNTGYCQSTNGGPAGDAFNASIGLPYGDYGYWTSIVMNLCTDSGGTISGAACICPTDKNYSKTSGKCE